MTAETKAKFLEAKLYQIWSICRNVPPTGAYDPIMEKLLEIWRKAEKEKDKR